MLKEENKLIKRLYEEAKYKDGQMSQRKLVEIKQNMYLQATPETLKSKAYQGTIVDSKALAS